MEVTDLEVLRQLRFYLRLSYPVSVTASARGFRGRFPDLPGCACEADDLRRLHRQLEKERRAWITRHVMAGGRVPMPNSHIERPTRHHAPEVAERPIYRLAAEPSQAASGA